MQRFNPKNSNFSAEKMKEALDRLGPKQIVYRVDEHGRHIKIYEPGFADGYNGQANLVNSKAHTPERLIEEML